MLSIFRRGITAKIMLLVLGLALFALVITGFGTGGFGGLGSLGGGASSDTLATVDGRTLTESEVTDILNRQYAQARQQQPTLDMAAFLAEGFDPIVDQLILSLAVQAFGEDQGLVVSQRMVDREIVNIPAFRNFTGQFDPATFQQALAAQNMTEAQLREDISRSLMQRQLLGPIARGMFVPEGLAREYANLLLERRQGTIGTVPTELLRAGVDPTPAEVAAYYNANRARFTIPERRVIQYAMIGPEQVGQATEPTEAEIAEFYRQNQATYGPRETRDLQSIVLSDQAAAQGFVQRVRGGTSFADAAAQAGFSASDVTFTGQNRSEFAGITSADVANAAFGAQQGAVVGPIRSELGFHVVRVEQINQTPARPLEAVRDEIVETLRQRKLAEALNALVTRIEDQLAEGASLTEIAQAERLNVVTTPPITETGQVPGQAFVTPPELQSVLRSAFELDPEEPEPAVEEVEPNQRFALLGVERVVPAAPPPLAQIQTQVREALIRQRALERARAIADQIAQRINGGMAPAEAFAQAQPQMPAPESVNLQRLEISRAGEQAPPPLITLFSIPQGRAQVMAAPNGAGWFVVHHAQRTPGDASDRPELVQTTRGEFTSSGGQEMAEQFARAIEQATQVERNEEAIRAARQRLLGGVVQ